MKIIKLQQNSQEWLEFRRGKIGASDAPIIFGVSPFKTPYQLFVEKTEGVEGKQNSAMRRGHDLEEEARKAFEGAYRKYALEDVCVVPLVAQSEDYEWMIASLDGVDLDKKIAVEIKCPGEKDHKTALEGRIPTHYIPQLQHQLLVTGYDTIYYFSYRPGEGHALIPCKVDMEFLDALIKKESEFMKCVLGKNPPELLEKDYEERVDFEFLETATKFAKVKEEIEKIREEEDLLKNKLIMLSENRNCRGGKVKVSHCTRRGNVDYGKVHELSGVDLERYRKPATRYSTVTMAS